MKTDDVIGGDSGVGGATSLLERIETQQTAILGELRLLTTKVKDDARDKKECSEWKLVAMVVDRLCLYLFSIFFFVSMVAIFRRQLF